MFARLVLAFGLLAVRAAADDPPKTPDAFPGPVGWCLPNTVIRLGTLDSAGNFLRAHGQFQLKSFGGTFGGPNSPTPPPEPSIVNAITGRSDCYEYRSGRLIVCTNDPTTGSFVPVLGSEVTNAAAYDKSDPLLFIANHPATWKRYMAFWNQGLLGPEPRPKAAIPVHPRPTDLTGTPPPGWAFDPFHGPNVHLRPRFVRQLGERMEFGSLTDRGEFDPDDGLPPFTSVKFADPHTYFAADHTHVRTPTKLPFVYNRPRDGKPAEDVYEFRSGRLIEGELKADGNFVPKLGSKVTSFKDYAPGPAARRIYNLPGVLRPVAGK
jgi:hypothetical protein